LARLTRGLSARSTALPAQLLAAWRQRNPKQPARRLETLLHAVAELRAGEVNDAQLLYWTHEFDRFEQEMSTG
jgi:hypothetical protein